MKDAIKLSKKEIAISTALVVLGFIFECLHLSTDTLILNIKFWILGVISITVGFMGLWIYLLIPILNYKAKNSSKAKLMMRKD